MTFPKTGPTNWRINGMNPAPYCLASSWISRYSSKFTTLLLTSYDDSFSIGDHVFSESGYFYFGDFGNFNLAVHTDMIARGLEEPFLVTSDKHKDLKRAVREVFPHAFKQPCLAHKMRNILCKLPKKIGKEIKPLIKQVFYASSYEEGIKLGNELIARFKDRYTSAMECMEKDRVECLTYLRFP